MASIGVRYPRYCPYTINVQDDGSETEVLGVGKVMGKAMSVNVTINAEAVTQYADDGPAEVVAEFNSGTVANENNDLIASVEAELLGKTLTESGEVISSGNDSPPYCRVGWIESRMLNGNRSYIGRIYTRVKYSPPSLELQTKGESITFGSVTLNGTIMLDKDGNWERHQDFPTLNQAIQYLNQWLNMGGETPELTFTSVPENDASDVEATSSIVITFSNVIDHGDAALFNATTYDSVEATVSFDKTKKIVTIQPTESLLASTKYMVVLSGVTDAYNQTLENTVITFTTASGG